MGKRTSVTKCMNLLYANDKKGAYPESWYVATSNLKERYEVLNISKKADVCVVGAGYTGLSSALHLAEKGFKVILLEAQRVGFGASGRNGGQLGTGQRLTQRKLNRVLGRAHSEKLWQLSEQAKHVVKNMVKKYEIDCYIKPGIASLGTSASITKDLHLEAEFLSDQYGYNKIEKLDRNGSYKLCKSLSYYGGYLDMGASHLHPLRLALGLAKAAREKGVEIHEMSRVLNLDHGKKIKTITEKGTVESDFAILACNGYLGNLNQKIASMVMPINNFILATEPLEDKALEVLSEDIAVADSKFIVNYFRLSHDQRLIFGGGESYGYKFPKDLVKKVRKPMLKIFPHLEKVRIDYAWGGTLAITMDRMPYFAKIKNNILSASGYSGHGVGMANLAGKILSDYIAGDLEGFNVMADIPSRPFPGGKVSRHPLLILAMLWYSLRDRFGL